MPHGKPVEDEADGSVASVGVKTFEAVTAPLASAKELADKLRGAVTGQSSYQAK